MEGGYLYRRLSPATAEELVEMIQSVPGMPAWRVQEQTDALDFEQADPTWLGSLPAGLWPEGRVFGPQAEVRWWGTEGGGYGVLVLRETRWDAAADWQEQPLEVTPPYSLYLWGERGENDDCWIETRVPRPLHYPLSESDWLQERLPYVVVEARDYAENGVVRLTRLLRLKPACR